MTDRMWSWAVEQGPLVVLLLGVIWLQLTERLVTGVSYRRALDTITKQDEALKQQQATNAKLADGVRDSNSTGQMILDLLRSPGGGA